MLITAAAANDRGPATPRPVGAPRVPARGWRDFSLEPTRSDLFVRTGRFEAYCCLEREGGWWFSREAGGLDVQAWRVRLIVDRAPR